MSVQSTAGKTIAVSAWRTPLVIITCGCLIGAIGFGPRAALGLFLTPMSSAYGWGRDVFALALAIQVLIWGAATPFAGAIADRFGSLRVLSVGAVLYCAGLVLMAYSTTPGMLEFLRRRSHRPRHCRHVVHAGAGRVQQIDAARMAWLRLRRRDGRRLIRAIPVLAAGGRVDQNSWLAACADRARHLHASHDSMCLRRAYAADGCCRDSGRRAEAIAGAGAVGSFRPSQLRSACDRLLHMRLPASVHHRASAVISRRPRAFRRCRRLDHRCHRTVQHLRLDRRRLARRQDAEALPALDHLSACARWQLQSSFRFL